MEEVKKNIKSAKFLTSISDAKKYQPFSMPEIIFVGRSNVGKSSLINMLANNHKLARVSATQGKTRLVNFFDINSEFVLVDLPGYGYAEASKSEQENWTKLINDYLDKSTNIAAANLLVDIRHAPTSHDIQMLNYLVAANIPVTIIATKFDKISKSQKLNYFKTIAQTLKVGTENIFAVSAKTGFGRQELINRIYQFVGETE